MSRACPDLWEPRESDLPGPPDRERERGREVRQAKPVKGGPDEVTDKIGETLLGAWRSSPNRAAKADHQPEASLASTWATTAAKRR